MDRSDLARAIYAASHLTGRFTLRSGAVSDQYFDKYRFESDPPLLAAIAEALAALVPDGTEGLAGLELGGVPLAVQLSQVTGLPALFVRKEAKTYGTCQLAEGGSVDGRHLTVVEHALYVIDRESGGAEALAAIGVKAHPLFTMSELEAAT